MSFGPLPQRDIPVVSKKGAVGFVHACPFQFQYLTPPPGPCPTTHTSLAEDAQTASNVALAFVNAVEKLVPSHCCSTPGSATFPVPAAQMADGPIPQRSIRSEVVPLGTGDQVVPFQCRTVPQSPTAQTSLAALPHIERSPQVVPLGHGVQVAPSKCTIEPKSPTAQTSLGADSHIA